MTLAERIVESNGAKAETLRPVATDRLPMAEELLRRGENLRTVITGGLGGIGKAAGIELAGIGGKIAIVEHPATMHKALDVARDITEARARGKREAYYSDEQIRIVTQEEMATVPVIKRPVTEKGELIRGGVVFEDKIVAPDNTTYDISEWEPKPLTPKEVERIDGGDDIAVLVIPADVTNSEEVHKAVRIILQTWGGIDVLVNAAGITRDASLRNMSGRNFRQVLKVNLEGPVNVTQQVLETMIFQGKTSERGGRIINIGSVNGVRGQRGQTNYAASKAALAAFSKSLADEVVSSNINVTTINPGYVDTDMTQKMAQETLDSIRQEVPMKRLAGPEEIAREILNQAIWGDYTTGAEININGGLHK